VWDGNGIVKKWKKYLGKNNCAQYNSDLSCRLKEIYSANSVFCHQQQCLLKYVVLMSKILNHQIIPLIWKFLDSM